MSTGKVQGCKLVDAVFTETSKGNDVFLLKFQTPDSGQVQVWLHYTDAARPHTDKKLASLGFNGNYDQPGFSPHVYNDGIELAYKPGQKPNSWEWDLANWGEAKPVPQDRTARYAAQWRSQNANVAVPAGRPPSPTPGAAPATSAAPASTPAAPAAAPPPPPASPPASAPASAPAAAPAAAVNAKTIQFAHGAFATPKENGAGFDYLAATKDGAWACFLHEYANQPNLDAWNAIIVKVVEWSSKPETQFGAAEWQMVANNINVPF